MSAAAPVTSRNRYIGDESMTPLHDALEAERIASERAAALVDANIAHNAAKVEQAREMLATAHTFTLGVDADGNSITETLTGTAAVEKAYDLYLDALRSVVIAYDTLGDILPVQRHAARILELPFPEPMSVRSTRDHNIKQLRESAFYSTSGDI